MSPATQFPRSNFITIKTKMPLNRSITLLYARSRESEEEKPVTAKKQCHALPSVHLVILTLVIVRFTLTVSRIVLRQVEF